MKTVITKSGNFVVATEGYYETAVSRPYLNHCNLERRKEQKADYSEGNLAKYYQSTFEQGMFEGYDYGHDLGINDPYAQIILSSNILLES